MLYHDFAAYGVRDDKLLFISDVERGLACKCVCVGCGQPLVAKKGEIRRHHFSHFNKTNCHGASESILHLLSKELLSKLESIKIPSYEFSKSWRTKRGTIISHHAHVARGGHVRINNVRIEAQENGFVPDIIICSGSKSLIIEIAVSHKVDRTKLRKIRRRDLAAIEIRLDVTDSFLPRDLLKKKLQQDLNSKFWLFHPDQRKEEQLFLSKWRQQNKHERTLEATLYTTTPDRAPTQFQAMPHQPSLSEYDRTLDAFYTAHGRYPTMEECLRTWPHLWKP